MSEFEDKINKILSSPEDMEKIMGMVKSLSGSLPAAGGASDGGAPDLSSLGSVLGGLDPKVIGVVSRLLGEYSSRDNDKTALLSAVKPYLKEDRREKIDKAAEMARLAKIARIAFAEFKGGGDDV